MEFDEISREYEKLVVTCRGHFGFSNLNLQIAPRLQVYFCQGKTSLLEKLKELGYSIDMTATLFGCQYLESGRIGVDMDYLLYFILRAKNDQFILVHYVQEKSWLPSYLSWFSSMMSYGSTAYYFERSLRRALDDVNEDQNRLRTLYRAVENDLATLGMDLRQILRVFGKDLEEHRLEKQEQNLIHFCAILRAFTYVAQNSFYIKNKVPLH